MMTVDLAFQIFNKYLVNLDPERTKKARASRSWLIDQIDRFPSNNANFPALYSSQSINFGSFDRNTKVRELDDVDLIICLHAANAYYSQDHSRDNWYEIHTEGANRRLQDLSDSSLLNSRKVVNLFVKQLDQIDNYRQADIHRNQEAAVLDLASYEWSFDIVPAFYTTSEFYLIPNGEGAWKATNPEIDKLRLQHVNGRFNGLANQLIRTLKFWNRRTVNVPSYLFEVFVIDFLESRVTPKEHLDVNMIEFWAYLQSNVFRTFSDPKKIERELNTLSGQEKNNVSEQAKRAYDISLQALKLETDQHDHKRSIQKWSEIFGRDFIQN